MKQITLMLGSPPYGGQDVDTVIGIADAALKRGHQVAIVGSGDGTYAFLKDQRASGAPNAEKSFIALIERGARIDL
ncbi:MAG: DsrE family protein [Desulfobacterales bacterium]|jgi:sulfur relay (sulfurtransferase) complex TusBCD TusD component (DsrE family)